ncbi:MAG: M48 family metalloprotease [Nitrospinota bacterium]|nr:M48 family metalloprotease [Nitrospinota bacterium]
MSLTNRPRVPCPNCGFMNRSRAVQCALCGDIMVEKGTARPIPTPSSMAPVHGESAESPPPPLPTPKDFSARAMPAPPSIGSAPTPPTARTPAAKVAADVPPGAMAAFGGDTGSRTAPLPAGPVERSTFYAEKEMNIRKSYMMLFAMTAILALLGAAIGGTYGAPDIGVGVAFVIAFFLGWWSWAQGASMIIWMSGATRVDHDQEPMLYNVVEEMRIASGLPMPEVYIMESAAPNAFATGRDPERSAVAVTRGLLDKLDRDELQGVIAHEMAHIGNYDIRYAMLAAVLAGAIAMISDAFLRGRGGPRGGHPILLILAILLAVLAPFSAYLLQMAVSRKRELLADATAVQFTRNPEGLASALAKIALDPEPLNGANRATQHMYIINPLKSFSMSSGAMFATHPPTEARINALRKMGARV